mgnify:CR=1 FL=1
MKAGSSDAPVVLVAWNKAETAIANAEAGGATFTEVTDRDAWVEATQPVRARLAATDAARTAGDSHLGRDTENSSKGIVRSAHLRPESDRIRIKGTIQFETGSAIIQKGADAIYMLGSGWRTLHIIDLLEKDLGVPVVQLVGLLVLGPIIVNILAFHGFVMKGEGLFSPLLIFIVALA